MFHAPLTATKSLLSKTIEPLPSTGPSSAPPSFFHAASKSFEARTYFGACGSGLAARGASAAAAPAGPAAQRGRGNGDGPPVRAALSGARRCLAERVEADGLDRRIGRIPGLDPLLGNRSGLTTSDVLAGARRSLAERIEGDRRLEHPPRLIPGLVRGVGLAGRRAAPHPVGARGSCWPAERHEAHARGFQTCGQSWRLEPKWLRKKKMDGMGRGGAG